MLSVAYLSSEKAAEATAKAIGKSTTQAFAEATGEATVQTFGEATVEAAAIIAQEPTIFGVVVLAGRDQGKTEDQELHGEVTWIGRVKLEEQMRLRGKS